MTLILLVKSNINRVGTQVRSRTGNDVFIGWFLAICVCLFRHLGAINKVLLIKDSSLYRCLNWWTIPASNQCDLDFQSSALPSELTVQIGVNDRDRTGITSWITTKDSTIELHSPSFFLIDSLCMKNCRQYIGVIFIQCYPLT